MTSQMTKISLDTEFLDDGRRVEPVSLALDSQTTAEYYAVCADSDITQITGHPWLRAHVIPHLPITVSPAGWRWDTTHPDYPNVKPRARIASEIQAFLARQPDPENMGLVPPFDTVVLCQLFGPMSALPAEVPAFTRDLLGRDRRPGPGPPQARPRQDTRADRRA